MKLVGERKALAASVLVFYAFLYAVVALIAPMPEWTPPYLALAGVYATAFFTIVAGYFWARWFALGVALFGTVFAGLGLVQLGPEPLVLILGGSHLFVVLALSGEAMTAPFEGQEAWRARFHMDEYAVRRLGRSVIQAATGLPFILLYALAPKQGGSLDLAAAALAIAGVAGLVRLRTWGVFAMAAAAATLTTAATLTVAGGACPSAAFSPLLGALACVAATTPFVAPLWRALRA